jgi:hypothetical protein
VSVRKLYLNHRPFARRVRTIRNHELLLHLLDHQYNQTPSRRGWFHLLKPEQRVCSRHLRSPRKIRTTSLHLVRQVTIALNLQHTIQHLHLTTQCHLPGLALLFSGSQCSSETQALFLVLRHRLNLLERDRSELRFQSLHGPLGQINLFSNSL